MDVPAEFTELVQEIHDLRSLSLSEADTRIHLVDPVLRLLGYHKVGDIRREVPIPASREFIDYELRIDGEPRAIVEAKAMRHTITDQDAAQCVQYASILGTPWCLITNGVVWHLYYAYAKGSLAAKRVAEVSLGGDDAAVSDAWRVLALVAKDAFRQTNPLTQLLVERVVEDELTRPDSPTITALRRAIRERFGEQVPSRSILDALERWTPRRSSSVGIPAHEASPALPTVPPGSPARRRAAPRRAAELTELIRAGLLTEGASVECTVYGVTHPARIRDGGIELNGQRYDTPSAAASALRGGKASNGWTYWKYRGRYLVDLRRELEQAAGASSGESG